MCKNTKLKKTYNSLDNDTNTPNSTNASANSPSSSDNNNNNSFKPSSSSSSTSSTNTMNNTDAITSESTSASTSTSTSSSGVPLPPSSSPTTTTTTTTTTLTKKITNGIQWLALTYAWKEFSKYLANHQSEAAEKTFVPASYYYDDDNTFFDNTILTYGTDALIGIHMTYASYQCYMEGKKASQLQLQFPLGYKASALFASYAISVFSGAYAHYTYHDVDSMNTLSFRLLWTLCVGTVTIAGGFMGMCGSDICKFFDGDTITNNNKPRRRFNTIIGYLNDGYWWYYGIFMTVICIMGEISYKRPACDIFVAGTGQFLPTMYCELVLLSIRWKDAIPGLEGSLSSMSSDTNTAMAKLVNVQRKVRLLFYIGFALNAPLLPGYPLLVQYTNLSLGEVNALLHLNLTFAWGMQAWSLRTICAIVREASCSQSSSSSSDVNSNYVLIHRQGGDDGGSVGLQEKKRL